MIAVDTNILVYAHRRDSPWHAEAAQRVRELAEGEQAWAIAWPCLHEFLSVVTHARIYRPPTPLELALEQVEQWLQSPALTVLGEGRAYWAEFRRAAVEGRVTGGQVHDARVAALCLEHNVGVLWTADRDFSRFTALPHCNPLPGGGG